MLKIVDYDNVFFCKSKEWLSDPEIKHLTLTPDIDDYSREEWYSRLKDRSDYQIWGLSTSEGKPIGALGIKNIDYEIAVGEYWGYIGEKEYVGKGLGWEMIEAMIREAKRLGLNKLVLRVASFNERAIRLYKSCGFVETTREAECGFDLIFMEYYIERSATNGT